MPPIALKTNEAADLEAETLEATLSEAELAAEMSRFDQPGGDAPDLSRGGRIGGVNVHPNPTRDANGRMVGYGRPTVRMAWMWDGTETTLTLGWNPEGTEHNGARPYLNKKHCHCCGFSGFRLSAKLRGCPMCIKNNCRYCKAGVDRSKVIPCFYLNRAKVPYPKDTSGSVDCFLPSCVRRNGQGFKAEADMRFHARTKHRMEYASFMEAETSQRADKTAELEARVNALTAALLQRNGGEQAGPPDPYIPARGGTPEAPRYVPDKRKKR